MTLKNVILLLFIASFPALVSAQKYLSKEMPEVSTNWKDQTFSSTKSLKDNIKNVPQFSIYSKIIEDNKLAETLDNQEMVTVFVILDDAFTKLEKKKRDSILGNKPLMISTVKYLSVPGRMDKYGLETESKKHNGTFYLKTLDGQRLGVILKNGQLYLLDSEGRKAPIVSTDFYHKNGFFHIIDGLVFPATEK